MSQGNPVAIPVFYSYKIRLNFIFPSKLKFLFIHTFSDLPEEENMPVSIILRELYTPQIKCI